MSEPAEAVIHVVDDDAAMRTALTRLIGHAGYTVKSYASAGDFLVADPDSLPGCLVLDLELTGPGGLELQHAMQRLGNLMPIVFISAHHDVPRTVLAIKAGASDFLLKPLDAHALLAAIECALAAGAAQEHKETPPAMLGAPLDQREQVVLKGIVAGKLNKQMAAELALSERTIKTCRASLMRKLNAHSLAELVRRAEPILRDPAPTSQTAGCPEGQSRRPMSR